MRLVGDASELGELRRSIRELLAAAPPDVCCDVLLGVDEAVANALTHSCAKGSVAVHAAVDRTRVTVTVSDGGQGFDVAALVGSWPPASAAESGRGIFLLATLMDAVTVDVGRRTTVHMSRELADDGPRLCPIPTSLSATAARFGRRSPRQVVTPPDSLAHRPSAGPHRRRLAS